jgi:hypothetical protein
LFDSFVNRVQVGQAKSFEPFGHDVADRPANGQSQRIPRPASHFSCGHFALVRSFAEQHELRLADQVQERVEIFTAAAEAMGASANLIDRFDFNYSRHK